MRLMWSSITISVPATKPVFTPPAALVSISVLTPRSPEHADRKGDGAEIVALVDVRPSRQRRDRPSPHAAHHQPAFVADHP